MGRGRDDVRRASASSSRSPQLWIQAVFVFFLFFANFAILFGPLLLMNLSQMQSFEPGDAEWGVKLEDVRGQVEAKEEVRRVVDIWQSGEQFERAGGKRERGLLLFGAPGHGQDDAREGDRDRASTRRSSRCPARASRRPSSASTRSSSASSPARPSGSRASGAASASSSSTRSTPSACGGSRSARAAQAYVPAHDSVDAEDHLFFGPWGARDPSGDLIVETRAWRDRLFAQRRTAAARRRAASTRGWRSVYNCSCSRAAWAADGRRDRAQPAARRDGRHRQPAVLPPHIHEQAQQDSSTRRSSSRAGSARCGCGCRLHGRGASRSTSSAPRTSRSTGSTRR